MSTKVLSLEEAARLLGEGAVVALDAKGHWVWDPATGSIRRPDGKHFAVEMRSPFGFTQPVTVEMPSVQPDGNGMRDVGHVILLVAPDGSIKTVESKTVSGGLTREAGGGSHDKLDQPDPPVSYFVSNLKRIDGDIGVVVKHVSRKEGEGWMTPEEICSSHEQKEGKLMAALAIAHFTGLLKRP